MHKATVFSASDLLQYPFSYKIPTASAPFGKPPIKPVKNAPHNSFGMPNNGQISGAKQKPACLAIPLRVTIPESTIKGKSDGMTVVPHRCSASRISGATDPGKRAVLKQSPKNITAHKPSYIQTESCFFFNGNASFRYFIKAFYLYSHMCVNMRAKTDAENLSGFRIFRRNYE